MAFVVNLFTAEINRIIKLDMLVDLGPLQLSIELFAGYLCV